MGEINADVANIKLLNFETLSDASLTYLRQQLLGEPLPAEPPPPPPTGNNIPADFSVDQFKIARWQAVANAFKYEIIVIIQ